MKYILHSFIFILLLSHLVSGTTAQLNNTSVWWRGQLHREDGNNIVFNFEWKKEKGANVWYITNGSERIRVNDIRQMGDSFFIQMPVFESQFRLKKSANLLEGVWQKRGSVKIQIMPFRAVPGRERFLVAGTASVRIRGRWGVTFTKNKIKTPSVAEFKQTDRQLTGTFLNPTGDYRFLEGVVSHDTLLLSSFDGSHAYLFSARIVGNNVIADGWFYSGALGVEQWSAIKDKHASLPGEAAAMYLKSGEEKLTFTFNDLDGKPVSITDDRFKNKVVVVQIMGSWCPNCMDETAYLSDYYRKNRQRGIEIVSLAYEYSTDRERSIRSLKKFQRRFNVQYPMLLTGVSTSDSLRTEKTLPQLTPIKFFPSSVILDKTGKVRKIDTGFMGPGTGEHYLQFKKDFESTIDQLLGER